MLCTFICVSDYIFFGFWLCMCNSLIFLFFTMVFLIVSFIFFAKILTFLFCVFLQVFLGATSSFFVVFLASKFDSFCAVGYLRMIFCDVMFCLCGCILFCWFPPSFGVVVFFAYFAWSESIWICWFWCFLGLLQYAAFCFFAVDTQKCHEPLILPKFS